MRSFPGSQRAAKESLDWRRAPPWGDFSPLKIFGECYQGRPCYGQNLGLGGSRLDVASSAALSASGGEGCDVFLQGVVAVKLSGLNLRNQRIRGSGVETGRKRVHGDPIPDPRRRRPPPHPRQVILSSQNQNLNLKCPSQTY